MNTEIHSDYMAESASRALGAIINKFKTFRNTTFNSYKTIFYSGVASILDYAEIWGYAKGKSCEKVQGKAIRYYLGVHKFCPLPALIGDIGWLPCHIRRQINILRFWNRLIKLGDNRDYELKINNWSSEVENILDDLSMHNIFSE